MFSSKSLVCCQRIKTVIQTDFNEYKCKLVHSEMLNVLNVPLGVLSQPANL